MTVLVGIGNAQLAAIFELNATRALDLQELQVHRIGQPGQCWRLDALGADGGSIVVGLEYSPFQPAPQALALEFRVNAVQGDDDHVLRYAVNRHIGHRRLRQAAWVHRFVVAGDQAVGIAARGTQAIDLQVLLEKGANCLGVLRHVGGCRAGRPPDRVGLQAGAGAAP
ncbi:hypothetical protein D3C78_1170490 [compost metagenome]